MTAEEPTTLAEVLANCGVTPLGGLRHHVEKVVLDWIKATLTDPATVEDVAAAQWGRGNSAAWDAVSDSFKRSGRFDARTALAAALTALGVES
jgi:hypothetical protein